MKLYHLNDYCSPALPLAVWPVQKAGVNVLHCHDCLELAFITHGSGVCRINGVPYPVLRGDVYVLTPRDTHSYEMAPSCTFYNILFNRELLKTEPVLAELLDHWESGSKRKLYRFEDEEIDAENRRFSEIVSEFRDRRPGYESIVRSLFICFLVKLMRQENRVPLQALTTSEQPENVSRVLEYISRNADRLMTLKELSKLAGMSPSAFGSAFRQWTGSSVFDYIGSLRIRRARKLLEDRTLSIGEIALKLGFYDACHFSRMFRKRTGISPRQYRQL